MPPSLGSIAPSRARARFFGSVGIVFAGTATDKDDSLKMLTHDRRA